MGSIFDFSMTELMAFALVLMRMIGFVVSMPVIGTPNVPVTAKVLLSFALALILFPSIGWQKMSIDIESLSIVTMIVKELFLGLSFGFISRLFFLTITMAGQIMSVSLGISAAQLFNPTMGESSTALDQFYVILATLFFFAINGHHLLISGLFEAFKIVPITAHSIHFEVFQGFGGLVQKVMVLALKVSTPVLVTILFMNLSIAVVGRAVPQINILITSLPINILAGFFVMFIGLPLLIWQLNEILNFTTTELLSFFKSI